jgi:hypothetical protein
LPEETSFKVFAFQLIPCNILFHRFPQKTLITVKFQMPAC